MSKSTSREAGFDPTGEAPDVEIVAGREPPPHTQAPDWVGLADIAPEAHSLHTKLKMHVNQRRGDGVVWPTTRTLARLMKRSRGDKVTPWLKQLERIGAIEIKRVGMPRRSVYVVHSMPPEGYTGPTTLKQWYDANRAALDADRDAEKAKRDARHERSKAQVGAVTPESGEQAAADAVTPESGEQAAPESGEHVAPLSGREQYEVEQDEVNPLPPPPAAPLQATAPSPSAREVGGESEEDRTQTRVAGTALDSVLKRALTDRARAPKGGQRAALVRLLADALRAGWDPFALVAALADPLDDAKTVFGALRYRLRELGPPPAPSAAGGAGPAWCGECSDPVKRQRLGAEDRPFRCPACHPLVVGRANTRP